VVLIQQSQWIAQNRPRFYRFSSVDRIECDYCGGTGVIEKQDQIREFEMCPICFGVGGHLVRYMDKQDKLCPACGGMGRLYDYDTGQARTCERCRGRGLIRTVMPPPE
jgi:DnaJ-class molecular chaperone